MDIPKLVKEVSEQFGVNVRPIIRMQSLHAESLRNHKYTPVNDALSTSIKDIVLDLTKHQLTLQVNLFHENCNRWTNGTIIKSVPHFCKHCGAQVLAKEDSASLGVPVNERTKPGILIGTCGIQHSSIKYVKAGFEIHNLYRYDDRWWHICPGMEYPYGQSRMTIRKFPHTCKKCKIVLGDASFNLKTAFKLPHFVGADQ